MKHNKDIEDKSYEDIIERLQLIESNIDLKFFTHNDVDLWPLLKYQIGIKCFDQLDDRQDKLAGHWQRIFIKLKLLIKNNFVKSILEIFKRKELNNLKQAKYLFLSDEYSKRIPVGKSWIDVFIHPFISMKSIADDDYLILRSNQNQAKLKKPLLNELNISGLVLRNFIFSKISKTINSDNQNKEKIFNEIKKLFGANKDSSTFPELKDLLAEAEFIHKLSLKFEKILNQVKPKEVIVTHYLGYITAGLCVASKRCGIKISDIQHGVQGSLHPAYNYRNYPANGFNTTPEKYYVWSKSDFDNISLWNSNDFIPEIEIIGNPVKYLVEKDKTMIKMFNDDFRFYFREHLNKQLVLITLCWSYYISDIFLDVISRGNPETFFLIRFHPSTSEHEKKEVIEKLSKINNNNYEYKKASELPLHIIFKFIHLHMGVVSTAIPEGLEYGIKTIATGSRARSYYKNNNKYKGLIFSESSNDISNIIDENQKILKDLSL